jgi:flagellar motility protein MotE (MotC chaperone)
MNGRVIIALLAAGLLLAAPAAASEGGEKKKPAAESGVQVLKKSGSRLLHRLPPDIREDYQKYCYNIADEARDARYARQKLLLERARERLEALMRRLEKKTAEYRRWVKAREDIRRRMTRSMIRAYAKMEPEVAAQQIAQMEYAVAVAILTGLEPAKASAILGEMEPRVAGRLVNVIVGAVAEAGAGQGRPVPSAGEVN